MVDKTDIGVNTGLKKERDSCSTTSPRCYIELGVPHTKASALYCSANRFRAEITEDPTNLIQNAIYQWPTILQDLQHIPQLRLEMIPYAASSGVRLTGTAT